jgi:hypothetical protein
VEQAGDTMSAGKGTPVADILAVDKQAADIQAAAAY